MYIMCNEVKEGTTVYMGRKLQLYIRDAGSEPSPISQGGDATVRSSQDSITHQTNVIANSFNIDMFWGMRTPGMLAPPLIRG